LIYDLPPSASCIAGISDMYHHAWPHLHYFKEGLLDWQMWAVPSALETEASLPSNLERPCLEKRGL
jgi:hypothetical protein